jgi:predicted porin
MKKFALVLAALPAAAAVHAQSNVTLYGLVDAGVEWVNHASATGGSVTRLTSGGMNTSRFGLRGAEDLGGGLKAIFQLEGGLFIDSGVSDGALFGRQANVGLEGGFGRVIAGRSFTTAYDFMLPFDPMGYSPSYSWATGTHGSPTAATVPATPVNRYAMTTSASNLLKYQGTFSGFKVGATYAFGEQAGSTGDSAVAMLGVGYGMGPVSAAVTVERANANTLATGGRDKTTSAHAGLAYTISNAWAVKAGYRYFKRDNVATADLRGDTMWVGVNWQATPALGLTAAVYHVDVKDTSLGLPEADPTLYVLRAKYALSKRTDLYAVTGHSRAKNNQFVGLTRSGSPEGVTGFADTQTGVMVGVQHRF